MMRWWLLFLMSLLAGSASAQPLFSLERLYFGGGFGSSKVSDIDEVKTTVQGFAGYRLTGNYGLDPGRFRLAIEAGYQDTSDVSHDNGWVTPVVSYRISDSVGLLLRAGAEAGHDDGLIYGVGIDYRIERNMSTRLEYLERQEMRGVQFNVVYHPWSFSH